VLLRNRGETPVLVHGLGLLRRRREIELGVFLHGVRLEMRSQPEAFENRIGSDNWKDDDDPNDAGEHTGRQARDQHC